MGRLLLVAAAGLALTACDRLASPQDEAFGARVRAYLLEHPEVIEEAVNRLNARRQAQSQTAAVQAVRQHRQALERDPRDFVANPDGRVTVTQFYDYRCTYCIAAAPQILALIRERPDVRFVFKELPVFGSTSDRAARLALAVRRQNGDSLALYRDLMSQRPLDDAAVDRVARAHGVDPNSLNAAESETAAHLAAVRQVADQLRIDGTPTFVVGEQIIPGADMEALRSAIGTRQS